VRPFLPCKEVRRGAPRVLASTRPPPPEQIVERYAIRWSIEPANAVGKQQMGVGQARNRVKNAVERTVPFGMLIQSLVVIWYALHGHHPDNALARRLARAVLRRHDHQAAQDPDRGPVYTHFPRSAPPPSIT
jgi:hypothetical protein